MSAAGPADAAAPLVSIIVPSFNHGRFLPHTLDSILAQSYRPIEILVMDGASSDGTVGILRDYAARHPEIRWISEKDGGPADAVNKGFAMARGEIGAIQSSDDLYISGAIEAVVQVMRDRSDCGFVYGDLDCIDADGKFLGSAQVPQFSWEAFFGIALCIPQSSIFFRMRLAREVGGWTSQYYGCDLEFWLKLLLRTRAIKLPFALSAWRIYPEQRTRPERYGRIWKDYWRMIADSPDVKRAPLRVRRLALASRHLLALKMHPTGNGLALRWHALMGFFLHPTFWRYESRQWLVNALPEIRALRSTYRAAQRLRAQRLPWSRRGTDSKSLP